VDRITLNDMHIARDAYLRQLQALGYPTEGITLERATGVWTLTTEHGFGAPGVTGLGMMPGYIGSSAREAYLTLQTLTKTLEFAGEWMIKHPQRVMR
jgi:hypothetical protein